MFDITLNHPPPSHSWCILFFSWDKFTPFFLLILSELAQSVVDVGAVPLLVLCVQEPELSLKRIAASSLSDIAKHSAEVGGGGLFLILVFGGIFFLLFFFFFFSSVVTRTAAITMNVCLTPSSSRSLLLTQAELLILLPSFR